MNKLAKKLQDKFSLGCMECGGQSIEWEGMAKHVERLLLKAQIRSLNRLPTGLFDSTPYKFEEIEILTAQLDKLK